MASNKIACDVCEGTGRERLEGERTMVCHNGCTNGFFDAEPRDLDGQRASVDGRVGTLFVWLGVLCLETEDALVVTSLDPLTVELL